MDAQTEAALKTLTVSPRGKRPASWSASDQLALDRRVAQEQGVQRVAKKEQQRLGGQAELAS